MISGKFKANILDLGLSQIYLNRRKINDIKQWFEPKKNNEYEPLPVFDFGNNRLTLTDGHSRAYVAYSYGIRDVYVKMDYDDIVTCELGQKQYNIDIEWCSRFSIYNIADLSMRIVSDEDYQMLWIQRCERMHNLVSSSEVEKIRIANEKVKDMYLYESNTDLSIFYYEDLSGELYKLNNGEIEFE